MNGALVAKSTNQTIPSDTSTLIQFDGTEVYDTDGIFSPASNARFTVPSGFSWAKLTASFDWGASTSGFRAMTIKRNGVAAVEVGLTERIQDIGTTNGFLVLEATSAVVQVTSGDFFEVYAFHNVGSNLNILGGNNRTWFSIELFV